MLLSMGFLSLPLYSDLKIILFSFSFMSILKLLSFWDKISSLSVPLTLFCHFQTLLHLYPKCTFQCCLNHRKCPKLKALRPLQSFHCTNLLPFFGPKTSSEDMHPENKISWIKAASTIILLLKPSTSFLKLFNFWYIITHQLKALQIFPIIDLLPQNNNFYPLNFCT